MAAAGTRGGLRRPRVAWASPLAQRSATRALANTAADRRSTMKVAHEPLHQKEHDAAAEPPNLDIEPMSVLGLDKGASTEQIKASFRELTYKHWKKDSEVLAQVRKAFEAVADKKRLEEDQQLVRDMEQAVQDHDAVRGLASLSALIARDSAVEYFEYFPKFMSLVEISEDPDIAFTFVDMMKDTGMLPGDLYEQAFNDLLKAAAHFTNDERYERHGDFAMKVLRIMEKRNMKPEISAAEVAFNYGA